MEFFIFLDCSALSFFHVLHLLPPFPLSLIANDRYYWSVIFVVYKRSLTGEDNDVLQQTDVGTGRNKNFSSNRVSRTERAARRNTLRAVTRSHYATQRVFPCSARMDEIPSFIEFTKFDLFFYLRYTMLSNSVLRDTVIYLHSRFVASDIILYYLLASQNLTN